MAMFNIVPNYDLDLYWIDVALQFYEKTALAKKNGSRV